MNIPAFLLGAGLLFWGWQTGWWLIAAPMALAYEASHFIKWRWDLSTQDFRQTSHVCTILLVVVLVYLFVSERSLDLIFDFFQWLPLICFPLLVAQGYSLSNSIDIRALLFFKEREQERQKPAIAFNLTFAYFALCLLSASAANVRGISFYLGMFVLAAIALWYLRSPRFSALQWVSLILIAGSLGVASHIGLHQLHLAVERSTVRWMRGFYHHQTNPQQTSTAIGDIGSVKLSNSILFRVKPEAEKLPPQLLRQATYNKYVSGMWVAINSEFKEIKAEKDNNWHLATKKGDKDSITIKMVNSEQNLLNLPDETFQVRQLPAKKLEINQYGTVKTTEIQPGLISYQVDYGKGVSRNNPPTDKDLVIPVSEKAALDKIITQLHLREKSAQEILITLEKFFNTEFTYSLKLARRRRSITPLSAFLLEHQSGHCEYFATATTLILRSLGIPARYAVGYSVHEFSNWEKQYLVRGRNAHAWTLVYLNGAWQAFDTTPADWRRLEDSAAPASGSFFDLLSWLGFKLAQLVAYLKNLGKLNYVWWLIIPLIFLAIRYFSSRDKRKGIKIQKIGGSNSKYPLIAEDSEIYLIEQALNQLGLYRDRSETFKDWIIRVKDTLPSPDLIDDLQVIAELHYRYRFDPQGITTEEREKLKSHCHSWLANLKLNSEH
ncbi:MAG: hypothetical protein Tsb0014_20700 [Pleurocapsa sp.]